MIPKDWNWRRRTLWSTAKKRAKAKGLDFTIKHEDIEYPPDGKCPILQCELKMHKGKMERHTPSLDRVDSNLGYVPGNVRVISWWANYLKEQLTKEQVERMLEYMK